MSKSQTPISIIVADDDKAVRLVIAQALSKQGYVVHTTATAAGMWDLSSAGRGDLLITDVGFPDGDALDMLPRLKTRRPDLKVIVMSARANLLTAVKSQQRGVIDYLPKPFELKQLISVTKQALISKEPSPSAEKVQQAANHSYISLMGRSAAMQSVYKLVARLANQKLPVIIEAEKGSAKADVARALHDMSGSEEAPFIVMNCAQIPEEQHDNSLFGQQGAVQRAQFGTLFINNIETLSPIAQQKLAGALEAHDQAMAWPQRLFVGTTIDLREIVASNLFREDLYFSLTVAPVRLPPLRDRREDVAGLVQHISTKVTDELGQEKSLSNEALAALQNYNWPGNLRELDFIVRRLFVMSSELVIEESDVKTALEGQNTPKSPTHSESLGEAANAHIAHYFERLGDDMVITGLYDKIIEEVERPLIIQTLHLTKGNQIKAAQILGLNRNTLRKKIDWLHISKDRRDYR